VFGLSLVLCTDVLVDLCVVDVGDVEMYLGDIEVVLSVFEVVVEKVV